MLHMLYYCLSRNVWCLAQHTSFSFLTCRLVAVFFAELTISAHFSLSSEERFLQNLSLCYFKAALNTARLRHWNLSHKDASWCASDETLSHMLDMVCSCLSPYLWYLAQHTSVSLWSCGLVAVFFAEPPFHFQFQFEPIFLFPLKRGFCKTSPHAV